MEPIDDDREKIQQIRQRRRAQHMEQLSLRPEWNEIKAFISENDPQPLELLQFVLNYRSACLMSQYLGQYFVLLTPPEKTRLVTEHMLAGILEYMPRNDIPLLFFRVSNKCVNGDEMLTHFLLEHPHEDVELAGEIMRFLCERTFTPWGRGGYFFEHDTDYYLIHDVPMYNVPVMEAILDVDKLTAICTDTAASRAIQHGHWDLAERLVIAHGKKPHADDICRRVCITLDMTRLINDTAYESMVAAFMAKFPDHKCSLTRSFLVPERIVFLAIEPTS